jgi:hypothetical protein
MDGLSVEQLHGEIGSTTHCGDYRSYGSLGLSQTVGGYRVNSSADLHPCGEVMTHLQVGTHPPTQMPSTSSTAMAALQASGATASSPPSIATTTSSASPTTSFPSGSTSSPNDS